MKTVVIEVDRGTAETVRKPKDVNVEIVDLDLLREGDCEDIRQYWTEELSSTARKHVRRHHPKVFQAMQTALL
jgi:hypothetical protein